MADGVNILRNKDFEGRDNLVGITSLVDGAGTLFYILQIDTGYESYADVHKLVDGQLQKIDTCKCPAPFKGNGSSMTQVGADLIVAVSYHYQDATTKESGVYQFTLAGVAVPHAQGTAAPTIEPGPCGEGNRPYFLPGKPVTRGQVAKMLALATKPAQGSPTQLFEDVAPGSPFFDYVQALAGQGILGGYACKPAASPVPGVHSATTPLSQV